jgi:hypothetical protein
MTTAIADRVFSPREKFHQLDELAEAARWTQVLRLQGADEYLKSATIGSGDEEVAFEQAMSNLAHSYLRNRAPGLQDYELGFQMLDRGQDNERATGVFGFKVGEQLLLAPRFFRDGELKGNELLYLKEADTFVPMTEEWVNYLLGRKPVVLGASMNSQSNPMGIGRPDLRPLWESPLRNHGGWGKTAAADLAPAIDILQEPPKNRLLELVKSSSETAYRFVLMLDQYPHLVESYVRILGDDVIKAALDSAAQYNTATAVRPPDRDVSFVTGSIFQEKTAATPRAKPKLEVITSERMPIGLSSEESTQVFLHGYLIRDGREKTSEAYDEQSIQKLQNPAHTGTYDVLVKPGEFKKCLVIYQPRSGANYGNLGVSLVVDQADKSWIAGRSEDIYVDGAEDTPHNWFEDLANATPGESGTYVAVGPDGAALGPFEFHKSLPAASGGKCFSVHWRSAYLPEGYNVAMHRNATGRKCEPEAISFGEIKGSRLVHTRGIFYVPDAWKVVKLSEPNSDQYPVDCCTDGDQSQKQPPMRLGNMTDIELGLFAKTSALAVWSDGLEAVLNDRRYPNKAAFLQLVQQHGFAEKDAAAILQQAERKGGLKLRVKYAEGYNDLMAMGYGPAPFPDYSPDQDNLMGSPYPTHQRQMDRVPLDNMQPQDDRQLEPPGPDILQGINRAVQSGQRDILDVSSMGAMLRTSRDENLIDKHLSGLVEGMDALGRLIFNLYQNPEAFEDRYGDDDLPEIEDKMLSAFEDVGDVVLELRRRSISPASGLDLGDLNNNLSTRG